MDLPVSSSESPKSSERDPIMEHRGSGKTIADMQGKNPLSERSIPWATLVALVCAISSLALSVAQFTGILSSLSNQRDFAKRVEGPASMIMFNLELAGVLCILHVVSEATQPERSPWLAPQRAKRAAVSLGLMAVCNLAYFKKLESLDAIAWTTYAALFSLFLATLYALSLHSESRLLPDAIIHRREWDGPERPLAKFRYARDRGSTQSNKARNKTPKREDWYNRGAWHRFEGPDVVRLESINDLVSGLLANREIRCLFTEMLRYEGITKSSIPDAMKDDVMRIVQTFGSDLATEENMGVLFGAAATMELRQSSHLIAVGVLESACEILDRRAIPPSKMTDGETRALGHNWNMDDFSDEDVFQITTNTRVLTFFESNACLNFKANLLLLAHDAYEKRLISLLGDAALIGPSGDVLTKSVRLSMIREISWVPTYLFTTSSKTRLIPDLIEVLTTDFRKLWLSGPSTSSPRSRYHPLGWRSPCGKTRHVDIPAPVFLILGSEIGKAPSFINIEAPSRRYAHSPYEASNSNSGGSHTARFSTGYSQSGAAFTHFPGSQSNHAQQPNAPAPIAHPGSPFFTDRDVVYPPDNQYLFLCVTGSSRRFLSLNCNTMKTDTEFFNSLKHEYNNARGWLRVWFSLWQYDHCEFYQFRKYGHTNGGARLRVAFPEPTNTDYDFKPRTPEPEPPFGPISSDEFHDHYYGNDDLWLFNWRRYQLRARGYYGTIARELIDSVPKRKVYINMDDSTTVVFYGLCARERQSLSRIAMYVCICNIPALIFAFLWLFQWANGKDLQNGFSLLGLSATFTIGFATLVYSTADAGDKKKV